MPLQEHPTWEQAVQAVPPNTQKPAL